MSDRDFQTDLRRFVEESNRIEGLHRPPTDAEIQAHEAVLSLDHLAIGGIIAFVGIVAGAPLRTKPGMNVQVGKHLPPPGGPDIIMKLEGTLEHVNWCVQEEGRPNLAYDAHIDYETLHPFMDGNGRSGRALWLWVHMHHPRGDPYALSRGFLHTFYYETLERSR